MKIARMEKYKDASDALQAKDPEAIRRAVWDAKTYRPDGIVDAKTLLDDLTTPEEPCLHEYPFQGLQSKLRGIRLGELTTITAGSGISKSSFCRDLATHLLNQGERVGYVALEESNRRTALGLMSAATGQSLHIGEHDRSTLTKAYQDSIAKWNLFLFDRFGSFDPDVIYNRIEYLATGLEVRVVFLDHLSILLSGLDGDERRMLDITMTRLRSWLNARGLPCSLYPTCGERLMIKTTRKEPASHSDSYADQLRLLSSRIQSSHWSEINRADLNEMAQQCASLRIAIQARLVSRAN